MLLKETLRFLGFPLPSDKKLKIFRGRIQKMLNREKDTDMTIPHDYEEEELLEEWEAPFSAQHTFESFMRGGPKHVRTLNARVETMIKAPDGSTTEQYKNRMRERVYDDMQRWGALAGLNEDTILQAQMLFHRVRVCAARLHSPLTMSN